MKTMWLKNFRASGQGVPALALGLLLASFANEDGTGIRTSPMALASMLGGCSERTLNRHMNALVKEGWIRKALVNGGGESLRLAVPQSKQVNVA